MPGTCKTDLGLRATVRVVFGSEVWDDEAVVAQAVNPSVTHPTKGQLVYLPTVGTLGDVGDDGIGETRHDDIIWKPNTITRAFLSSSLYVNIKS